MYSSLADLTRRRILELLRSAERPVGELVLELGVTQSSVSKHLRVLRDAELVNVRVVAQQRYYRIRQEAFEELAEWAASFLTEASTNEENHEDR